MAVCLKTHMSYEVIVSGWNNPVSFAMQITSYRPDGSRVDVYNYTATWGSEYYYQRWLQLAANFSPEFSDVQREPGRMDVLNQFLRAPGVITTLRTSHTNYPCDSVTTMENLGNGAVAQTYVPQTQPLAYVYFQRPDSSSPWVGFARIDDPLSPSEGPAGNPHWEEYAQLINRDTGAVIASSNVVTLTPSVLPMPIITVIDFFTITVSWPGDPRPVWWTSDYSDDGGDPWYFAQRQRVGFNGNSFFWIFDGEFYRFALTREWDSQQGPWTPPRDS